MLNIEKKRKWGFIFLTAFPNPKIEIFNVYRLVFLVVDWLHGRGLKQDGKAWKPEATGEVPESVESICGGGPITPWIYTVMDEMLERNSKYYVWVKFP